MVSWNLRSLLWAAIILSNCITWSASRRHYTHNVFVHRSRHRRQGAGLIHASYVIPEGEGSGPWGEWGPISPCSRTCGGGVASQKRICLEIGADNKPTCTGGDTKYFSCETQDCPTISDFRAEQCAEYNKRPFKDVYYNWEPYTKGLNPCSLVCKPVDGRFYFRFKEKVIDGTRCNDHSFDVCVNGTCQSVGCDMMLGSNSREDKCAVCRGNGTSCQTVEGILDSQHYQTGYNDMLLIPENATNIHIYEIKASNNYLALRNQNHTFYLNGDYKIGFPQRMVFAGMVWYYERNQSGFSSPDELRSRGPTTEPLYLSLLLQGENVGVRYEYSIPKEGAQVKKKYSWTYEQFSVCNASCGGGVQTRLVSCRSDDDLELVDEELCDRSLKPPTEQTCNTQACAPEWVPEPWGPCTKRCSPGGSRSREIKCKKIVVNGLQSTVGDKECFDLLGPKPELFQACNENVTCPTWFTGPWKACNRMCGDGQQTRLVVCHQHIDGKVEILRDDECEGEKPESEKPCILRSCEGVDWITTAWTGCDSCESRVRTRRALCATASRKTVDDKLCAHHPKPVLEEACDPALLPPCDVMWYATQWGKCSVECGEGIQSRNVFCGMLENDSIKKVDDDLCDAEIRYNDTKPCEVPLEECKSQWFAGPWGKCSEECEQSRKVFCVPGPSESCNKSLVLEPTRSCNKHLCGEDDLLPVNPSTPLYDDFDEDCEDSENAEIGAEEKPTSADITSGSLESLADDLGTILTTGYGSSSVLDTYPDYSSSTEDTESASLEYTTLEDSSTEENSTDTSTESTDDFTKESIDFESMLLNSTYKEKYPTTPTPKVMKVNPRDPELYFNETETDETESFDIEYTTSAEDMNKTTVEGTKMTESMTTTEGNATTETTIAVSELNETTDSILTTLEGNATTESTITASKLNETTESIPTTSDGNATTDSTIAASELNETTGSILTTSDGNATTDSTIAASELNETTGSILTTLEGNATTDSTIAASELNETTEYISTTLEGNATTDSTITLSESNETTESKLTTEGNATTETTITSSESNETTESKLTTEGNATTETTITSSESNETTESILTTEGNATTEAKTTTPESNVTTESILTTEGNATTETTITSSESNETTESILTTEGNATTEATTTTPESNETTESILTTEGNATTETTITSSESNETTESILTTEGNATTEAMTTTPESNETTESILTTEGNATTEATTTTPESNETTESILTTEGNATTEAMTITPESNETTESILTTEGNATTETTITSPESNETTESILTTEGNATTETTITSSESNETTESILTTEGNATTETTITSSESNETTESISTTEGNATTEATITSSESNETTESILTTEGNATTETTITSSESNETTESILTTEGNATTETTITSPESNETTESILTTEGNATTETTITSSESNETTESLLTTEGNATTETTITSSESNETTESISTTEGNATTETTITSSESNETTESKLTTEGNATTETTITSSESNETTESILTTEGNATTEAMTTTPESNETTESILTTEENATTEAMTTTPESNETTESILTTEGNATTETTITTELNETTESISTTEGNATTESTITTELNETTESISTTEGNATTESTITTELNETTESISTTEGNATTESTITTELNETTESISTTEGNATTESTITTELNETTESISTTEGNATTESTITTELNETTESISTTEGNATTESTITTELNETTEPISTTEGNATTESTITTELNETTESISTTEGNATTESTITTELNETTESISTTEGNATTEYTITTELNETTDSASTESGSTEGTSVITEGSTTVGVTSDTETTPWTWHSTVEIFAPTKKHCKPRKKPACSKAPFGCCPDNKTPANGTFDEGCDNTETCDDSEHGCCPDGVSPASGPRHEGCPITPCNETLFGCCASDNITAAEGNNQEGCPPPPPACLSSEFGCCDDNETEAQGPLGEGCYATTTSTVSSVSDTDSTNATEESITTTVPTTVVEGCAAMEFGCCYDNQTAASGPEGQGCPCITTEFGCCPDSNATATGPNDEGCVMPCNTSTYGCCSDAKTPAHGPNYEGCCLLGAFGCCPDNYRAAEGPNHEGCGCQYSPFGCCPDNTTSARGADNEGCGCQYTKFGCCPDGHTEASGREYEGCPCHTYQFGCCPDGATPAKGPQAQGCRCLESEFGCCKDGVTAASGPDMLGCDCSASEYGCCPDGKTEAHGPRFDGCTDIPENRQASCSLAIDRGTCRNFSVQYFYDREYGACSRFWYGGCEGNGNRFATEDECKDVCVQPPPKDVCKLPKIKGVCEETMQRWYYDYEREQCSLFLYGGCLGNANNFETRELCEKQCAPPRSEDQCTLPIDSGPCSGIFGRWGYNSETGQCDQFIWGGCEGNINRFNTEAACLQRCNPPGTIKPECTQPQMTGNCTEKHAVWSFSQPENRCVPFYYTGCEGNGNRFESERSCAETCPSSYVQDDCHLPATLGTCTDYKLKWYFDTASKRCRQFYYGGCDGNANNFDTEQECENRCVAPPTTAAPVDTFKQEYCFLRSEVGPCDEFVLRWTYDSSLGQCIRFQYSGCGGNPNNFHTQQECEDRCHPAQDACQLPMRSGSCDGLEMKWFYDTSSDSCSQFTYSGCDGNENRFDSLEDCEARCRTRPVTTTTTTTVTVTGVPHQCQISASLEECATPGVVWYLDTERNECVHFRNTNGRACRVTGTFASREQCQQACLPNQSVDPCEQQPQRGRCEEKIEKWYYNKTRDACTRFLYSGCEGNDNRFDTQEECEGLCKKMPNPLPGPELEPGDGECRMPPSLAPCGGNTLAYYYDPTERACVAAYIGDCNYKNTYRSEEECERRCGRFVDLDVCKYPLDPGSDRSISLKYYWDAISGSCKSYAYGGSGGSPNRFSSLEECEEICKPTGPDPACLHPLEIGTTRCGVQARRWYYSTDSGLCLTFIYQGCDGNENNFPTSKRCDELCRPYKPAGNEVTDCQRYEEQCKALECTYGVARVPTEDSCERCVCASPPPPAPVTPRPPGPNCTVHEEKCRTLQCPYGVEKTDGGDGCDRCSCLNHPCAKKHCPEGERCVPIPHMDRDTKRVHYTSDCGIMRKPGTCPAEEPRSGSCRRECNDDADCRGADKCCTSGCRHVCLPPAGTTTTLYTTTTQEPPSAPAANIATEPEVVAELGGKATLRCLFHGNPPPKITWRRGEITIDGDRDRYRLLSDGALEIAAVYRNDSGVYICIARNDLGISQQEVTLTIKGDDEVSEMCTSYEEECRQLRCNYGMQRTTDKNGCQRCHCSEHPCYDKHCPEGERCIPTPYRDYYTRDIHYNATCRTVDKMGACPAVEPRPGAECRRECYDDADCRDARKCCTSGCSFLCLAPVDTSTPITTTTTTTTPLTTTTHEPPSAPVANIATEPEVIAVLGGKATLRCLFHGNPPPKITWRRGEITIDGDRDRYRLLSDGALEIAAVYRNDSGVYICIARNDLGISQQEVTLTIKGEESEDCRQYEAECASLRCEWGVQRARLPGGCERCACVLPEQNCTLLQAQCDQLRCTYGRQETTDSYGCPRCSCTAHPCEGISCSEGKKCVIRPYLDTVTNEKRFAADCVLRLKSGSCPAEPPRAGNSCRQECTDDADCRGVGKCCSSGCSQLCLSPVYTTPTTPTTPMPFTTLSPNLLYAPQVSEYAEPVLTVSVGDKATLKCLVNSNPPPRITWRRGEVTIDGKTGRYHILSDGALEIVSVYRNDSGVYICTAENILGTAHREITLSIKAPVDRAASIAGDAEAVVEGSIGRPLTLRCLAYGHPPPAVAWYRPNQEMVPFINELYEARDSVLHIRDLNAETLGKYECQAFNGLAKPASWFVEVRARTPDTNYIEHQELSRPAHTTPAPATTHLTDTQVAYRPVSTAVSADQTQVAVGGALRLRCEADGYPLPDVHWTKDGQRLRSTNRLQLSENSLVVYGAMASDSGDYGCVAANQFSSHSSTVHVTVRAINVPPNCNDNPLFANCVLIVRSKFCKHTYYSSFCCKSCAEAGQLDPQELERIARH